MHPNPALAPVRTTTTSSYHLILDLIPIVLHYIYTTLTCSALVSFFDYNKYHLLYTVGTHCDMWCCIMMMNVNNNKQRQHCWWLHVIQELYVIPVVPYADATSMWMQFAQPSIQYWYYQKPLGLVKSSIRDNGAIQYIQSRKDWSCLFNLFLTMPF